MPILDKKLFLEEGEIDPEDLAKLVVTNSTSEAAAKLTALGWDGKAKCCSIVLSLSADNLRVDKANFLVRGDLAGKIVLEANKLWEKADSNVTLVLKLTHGEIFMFSEGDLASDIVAQDAVAHAFYVNKEGRAPAVVLEADYHEWGIGEFSLRATAVLSNNSSAKAGVIVKLTILLFPVSKANLLDRYELAQCSAWPGLRVAEGHLPLFPRPAKPWGCPVLPLLITSGQGQTAPAEALQRAISGLMNKSVETESARTGKALLEKWRKIVAQPQDLTVKSGDLTWPVAPVPATEKSK